MSPSTAKNNVRTPKPLSKMISALQRARTFLTPTSSSTNIHKSSLNGDAFTTAPTTTALFPTVDPAVDGEDCDHDCATCTIEYPKKFSIEEDDQLYGHVKAWHTHMLVATGKTDWVRDVADEKGSVMEAVGKHGQQLRNGKLMLSASNMPLPCEGDGDIGMANPGWEAATTVLLLPSWTVVEGVRPGNVPELLGGMVAKGVTNTTPLKRAEAAEPQLETQTVNGKKDDETKPPSEAQPLAAELQQPQSHDPTPTSNGTTTLPLTEDQTTSSPSEPEPEPEPLTLKKTLTFTHAFRTHPSPHLALILLCSQKTRDARCGQSAPLLRREFERHLRPLGLYRDIHDTRPGGVGIYFISHVGGHKYSANVMVYRRRGIERFAGLLSGLGSGSGAASGTSTPMSVPKDGGEGTENEGAVQGIWLARVRPVDCEGIIKYTVLQGKVVKPERQLRGGFDRERGVASW
jgi:Sucrase/ferredoxin-like